jgi:transposase-like protein
LEGEAMSEVCREFGVSRKTGYKIFERYKDHGLEALSDRSRRPIRYANQLRGDRKSHRPLQAGEASLGRPQNPRAAGAPTRRRFSRARQEHNPCGSVPTRSRQTAESAAPARLFPKGSRPRGLRNLNSPL